MKPRTNAQRMVDDFLDVFWWRFPWLVWGIVVGLVIASWCYERGGM